LSFLNIPGGEIVTIQSQVLAAPARRQRTLRYQPEEYLALEELSEYKSEYVDGEIVPMTGGSINHNRIAGNAYALLYIALRSTECEALGSDMRVWLPEYNVFTYPDITVICDDPIFYPGRTDTITNPVLIVEVLSPSTEDYDRGTKFQRYRSLSTLNDYLLIHQASPQIEHYGRVGDGGWLLTETKGLEAVLDLPTFEIKLPLAQIYERVDWSLVESLVEK
jgi:Uma2 family endonuclease